MAMELPLNTVKSAWQVLLWGCKSMIPTLITQNTTFLQKAMWRCHSQKRCPKGNVGASRWSHWLGHWLFDIQLPLRGALFFLFFVVWRCFTTSRRRTFEWTLRSVSCMPLFVSACTSHAVSPRPGLVKLLALSNFPAFVHCDPCFTGLYESRSYDIGLCGTSMSGICYIIAKQYWEAWGLFWKSSVSLCFLGVLFGFGFSVVCFVVCCLVFCDCWWHLGFCLTPSLIRGNRQSKQNVLMTVWASSAHGTGKKKTPSLKQSLKWFWCEAKLQSSVQCVGHKTSVLLVVFNGGSELRLIGSCTHLH